MKIAQITPYCEIKIETTLKGAQRGRGSDRKWLGRHRVAATIQIGVSYETLVMDSMNALSADGMIEKVMAGCTTHDCDETTARNAITEVYESLGKTLRGEHTSQSHYEAYEVDGNAIAGVKVYNGSDDAKVGDIHLSGVRREYEVLEEDANGSVPKSKPRNAFTEAKKVARKLIPVGQWVQYRLAAGGDWSITAV
jgi:hypothetical protein